MTSHKTIATRPFGDQMTGSSGPRKKVSVFQQAQDSQPTLGELIDFSAQLAKIKHYTGSGNPDLVT